MEELELIAFADAPLLDDESVTLDQLRVHLGHDLQFVRLMIGDTAREIHVRPGAVEGLAEADAVDELRISVRMIGMVVRGHHVVDPCRIRRGIHALDVVRDVVRHPPLRRRRHRRGFASFQADLVTTVQHHRGAVRKDIEHLFADAGVDEVDLQIPFPPRPSVIRERNAPELRQNRRGRGASDELTS